MTRWFAVVQLYAHALWCEYPHEWHGTAFKYRRDADRIADELRRLYTDPKRWHVVVLRRRVKT